MDISIITAQLVKEKVISHYQIAVKALNGETTSTIYLLDEQSYIKFEESMSLREEVIFFSFYKKGRIIFQKLYRRNL